MVFLFLLLAKYCSFVCLVFKKSFFPHFIICFLILLSVHLSLDVSAFISCVYKVHAPKTNRNSSLSFWDFVCVSSTSRFLIHLRFLKIHGVDLFCFFFFLIHRWGCAPVKLSHKVGCGLIGPDGLSLPISLAEFLNLLSPSSSSPLQIQKKYLCLCMCVCIYVCILSHT